jgi:predicted nucleic acid-binding protein
VSVTPPARRVLVDTNVFSLLVWADRPRTAEDAAKWQRVLAGSQLVLSFATVGELRMGVYKTMGPKRVARMEERIRACLVVTATDLVTEVYARLRVRFLGQIGENDLWIAACALAQDPPLPIATTDGGFDEIAKAFPLVVLKPDDD